MYKPKRTRNARSNASAHHDAAVERIKAWLAEAGLHKVPGPGKTYYSIPDGARAIGIGLRDVSPYAAAYNYTHGSKQSVRWNQAGAVDLISRVTRETIMVWAHWVKLGPTKTELRDRAGASGAAHTAYFSSFPNSGLGRRLRPTVVAKCKGMSDAELVEAATNIPRWMNLPAYPANMIMYIEGIRAELAHRGLADPSRTMDTPAPWPSPHFPSYFEEGYESDREFDSDDADEYPEDAPPPSPPTYRQSTPPAPAREPEPAHTPSNQRVETDFSEQKFDFRDLTGMDFSNANLTNSTFIGTKLVGAKLTGAVVDGARFYATDLTNADLRGVDFSNVAMFACPTLAKAIWDDTTIWPSRVRVLVPKRARTNGRCARTNYGEHFTDDQLAIIATLVNIVVPVMLLTCGMPRQAEQVHALQVNRATFKSVSERIRTIHGRLHKASTKHSDAQFRAALAGIGAVDHALTAAFEVDDHTKEAMDKAFAAVDAAERAGAISTHDAGDLREDLNNAQAELHFRGVDFRGEYA